MKGLFDQQISQALALLSPWDCRALGYHPDCAAREGEPGGLILKREMAFELGEGSFPAVGLTAITQQQTLVPADGVFLYGPDLQELQGDCAFARVTLLRTDDVHAHGDQATYNLLKNLEVEKFRVWPAGYLIRASALSHREQVRVSKAAVGGGLRFSHVGNLLIQKYRENPHVQAAQVLFVTAQDAPYRQLEQLAHQVGRMAKTLNHALSDVSMDCRACDWKPVCDSVEGLRQLHRQQIESKGESS